MVVGGSYRPCLLVCFFPGQVLAQQLDEVVGSGLQLFSLRLLIRIIWQELKHTHTHTQDKHQQPTRAEVSPLDTDGWSCSGFRLSEMEVKHLWADVERKEWKRTQLMTDSRNQMKGDSSLCSESETSWKANSRLVQSVT